MLDRKQIVINVRVHNHALMAPRNGGLGMSAGFSVANALIDGIFYAL